MVSKLFLTTIPSAPFIPQTEDIFSKKETFCQICSTNVDFKLPSGLMKWAQIHPLKVTLQNVFKMEECYLNPVGIEGLRQYTRLTSYSGTL